jgi:hypothetical protein
MANVEWQPVDMFHWPRSKSSSFPTQDTRAWRAKPLRMPSGHITNWRRWLQAVIIAEGGYSGLACQAPTSHRAEPVLEAEETPYDSRASRPCHEVGGLRETWFFAGDWVIMRGDEA